MLVVGGAGSGSSLSCGRVGCAVVARRGVDSCSSGVCVCDVGRGAAALVWVDDGGGSSGGCLVMLGCGHVTTVLATTILVI